LLGLFLFLFRGRLALGRLVRFLLFRRHLLGSSKCPCFIAGVLDLLVLGCCGGRVVRRVLLRVGGFSGSQGKRHGRDGDGREQGCGLEHGCSPLNSRTWARAQPRVPFLERDSASINRAERWSLGAVPMPPANSSCWPADQRTSGMRSAISIRLMAA